MYQRWKKVAQQFSDPGTNSFVQYIRHVVTVEGGHILPKDLDDFIRRESAYLHANGGSKLGWTF